MTLKEYIFQRFILFYMGKKRAVKRSELLFYVCQHTFVTDREMRAAYEDLPICGGSGGLYLPETKAEIDEQIALHIKKIRAYVKKIKVLKNYKIESDAEQRELF